jgi:hypothetical protein
MYFYPWDVEDILKIKVSGSMMPDCFSCHFENNGRFSVRSAYRLASTRAVGLDAIGSSSAPTGERCGRRYGSYRCCLKCGILFGRWSRMDC